MGSYHSDMTRTVVVGKASPEQKEFYQTVLEGQLLGLGAVRAGASCRDIDAAVRQYFSERGADQYFTHAWAMGRGWRSTNSPCFRRARPARCRRI